MGDMRRKELVIRCGDSDLQSRIVSDWSQGGVSNLSRVEIDKMAERYGRGQGTGQKQK